MKKWRFMTNLVSYFQISSMLKAQIVKEFLSILRDPKVRIILIGPPLLQLFIFSYAITLEVTNTTIGIYNQDRGAYGTQLTNDLAHASFVKDVVAIHSQQALKENIDLRKTIVVVTIPQQFSQQLIAGGDPELQVVIDGRRANSGQVTMSYVQQVVNRFIADYQASNNQQFEPISVRHWFNNNLIYQWFVVPSLSGILSMVIALMLGSLSIARERELGTFDQLLVSPSTPTEIILAKIIPPIIIGFILGNIMVAAGVFIFKVPFLGSFWLLEVTLLIFIISIAALGLMVSAISNTQQQAILGSFALVVPLMLLSGFATPVANMPEFLQWVAQLIPVQHYLIIVQGIYLKGMEQSDVWSHIWPMLWMAVLFFIGAVLLVRTKLTE
ncbi:ABC transporter permease [Vibrio sp. SS-MA-C1-2]|uniref:ABC transporter permease n=1 Tax=Vibrio sp. SS-MA-C1-2 TaxID=2908646 RepID=UPI001F40CFDE|nr:ABC transporter permease [Vibrio sp. SS-MA-C1-2]UJF17119.1 ABC transporter permease [Vibrio sp. SS-MA-C1-2]